MLVNVEPAGGSWSSARTFASGCFDSSVSVRWSQYFWNNPTVLDMIFWTEKGPTGASNVNQLYYAEIRDAVQALTQLPVAQSQ